MYLLTKNNRVVAILDVKPIFKNSCMVFPYRYVDTDLSHDSILNANNYIIDGDSFVAYKNYIINNILNTSNDPVTIGEVTYNGGADSASAINGAVTLAQTLGETDVKIWDVDNVVATYTFDEALAISAQIAKAYRDAKLAKYDLVAQINACTTQEELDLLEV